MFFHELESKESEIIFEDDKVIVKTIPLKHRIYTNGFLFEEKVGARKLDLNAVQNYEIDKCYYQKIKNGKDILLEDGRIIENDKLTFIQFHQCVMLFARIRLMTKVLFPLLMK